MIIGLCRPSVFFLDLVLVKYIFLFCHKIVYNVLLGLCLICSHVSFFIINGIYYLSKINIVDQYQFTFDFVSLFKEPLFC